MKESILDVLMYLFENYEEHEFIGNIEVQQLLDELDGSGFPQDEIKNAMRWLDELSSDRANAPTGSAPGTLRVYCEAELKHLSCECRGLLMQLEHLNILNQRTRELVIERLMAIDDQIDGERVKWVVLLVLSNEPEANEAFECVETMVYESGTLH